MEESSRPKGLVSYDFDVDLTGGITYADMEFKWFSVREVYINGKQKGEYHIKPNGKKSIPAAVIYLKPHFPDCSIGMADPSGLLNLEYPIYLVCKNNPMVMDAIPQIFENIDEDMNGQTIP